ncbi:VTC domain-containing protein [Tessaracoccus bendigoensis DSM 12906]|uniref:VTC domain-containing protein n=2 Tax=Tessaracoccus TaxID=72763 RepID=A0A1M6CB82_9ACTN|nr:VTC domain-containing protein [Tessaracoccus bendigoensis DSM 12906]
MMTTLPIDRFAPITLPELLTEAELLTRFDRKYLLDPRQTQTLLQEFDPHTRVLEIDGRRCFRYESVYFDTPDLLSYRQAAHARRHRFKVRTRSYLDSGQAFLEVKVRGDREVTVKDRIGYDLCTRDQLTDSGRDYTEDTLHQLGMDRSVAEQLHPTLVTRYGRITLLPPEPGVRVTIDTDLSWSAIHSARTAHARVADGGDDSRSLALPDLVIVETKSGAHPSSIDRLLWRSGHRPLSISKYGTGLAALRGDLPSNKWARILRHHFHTEELSCAA